MGYWKQDEDGESFALDSEMIWGDQPADILDAALKKIVSVFLRDRNRLPTKDEVKAGLLFSLRTGLKPESFRAEAAAVPGVDDATT